MSEELESKTKPADELCIHFKHNVEHVEYYKKKQPDCMNCDGNGKKALKYNWNCYHPYILERRK